MNAAEDIDPISDRDAGPGDVLRHTREAQNLTVADVARQLKLSLNQVEALEAGEFERLPGPVFVRGFVRNYARLLRLDAAPLLAAVAERMPHEEPPPPAPPSQEIPFPTAAPRRWWAYGLALGVLIALLAAYEFLLGGPGGAGPDPVAVTPPPAPTAPALVAPLPAPEAPAPAADLQPAPAEAATPVPADPVTPRPEAGSAVKPEATVALAGAESTAAVGGGSPADPRTAPPEAAQPPVSEERQVHLVFEEESWVEIRDRTGKPIFARLNRPGTEQRVSGVPPLAIIVGNAHAVRMTYDEQPVNLSRYTRVDVARLTLE